MPERPVAEEARRWTLWRTTDKRWMSGDHDDIGGPIRVREDRVYEADLKGIEKAIHDHACGCKAGTEGVSWPVHPEYRQMALAVAAAVFSDPGVEKPVKRDA